MTAAEDMTLSLASILQKIDALLDEEKAVISNGDYEALIQISSQKMNLVGRLRDIQITASESHSVQAILQKSAENGLMVEAALRFWLGAHKKLMGMQGKADVVSPPRRNPYTLFQNGGSSRV